MYSRRAPRYWSACSHMPMRRPSESAVALSWAKRTVMGWQADLTGAITERSSPGTLDYYTRLCQCQTPAHCLSSVFGCSFWLCSGIPMDQPCIWLVPFILGARQGELLISEFRAQGEYGAHCVQCIAYGTQKALHTRMLRHWLLQADG